MSNENEIYFYSNKEEYGFLSNFERSKQIVDGIEYATNEHYYQSQKANNEEIRKWIREAPNPFLAMKAGRSIREKEMVENWDTIKFDVMEKGLYAKFNQNPILKEKLLKTNDLALHEDSPTDLIWGIKGKDMLGKLLMKIRNRLRTEST